MRIQIGLTASVLSAVSMQATSRAAEVVAHITTTVQSKINGSPPLPPNLAGVTVGMPVSITVRYDASAAPVANPFTGYYGLASMYEPPGMSICVTIGDVTIDAWTGTMTAFVWNNDPLGGLTNDGFVARNENPPGTLCVAFGAANLPSFALANESLPSGVVPGQFLGYVSTGPASGESFIVFAWWNNLAFAPVPPCLSDLVPIGSPDGVVNAYDLLAVFNTWGPCANPCNCLADLAPAGGDEVVSVQDLLAIIGAWGACP